MLWLFLKPLLNGSLSPGTMCLQKPPGAHVTQGSAPQHRATSASSLAATPSHTSSAPEDPSTVSCFHFPIQLPF